MRQGRSSEEEEVFFTPELAQHDTPACDLAPHTRHSPAEGACLGWDEAAWTPEQMLCYRMQAKPGREVARVPSSCSSSTAYTPLLLLTRMGLSCVCILGLPSAAQQWLCRGCKGEGK